jgi:carbamoyltransferase
MKTGLSRAEEVVDGLRLLAHSGLKPDCGLFFSNHHFAHALPSLFFTD